MPARSVATQELASLFGVLSHPQRVRILEELRDCEHDVNFLSETLKIRHSRVSQHLSLLRSHRLVKMRRDGRHVFYRLANPAIAQWLVLGLRFIEAELLRDDDIHAAVEEAREAWSSDPDAQPPPKTPPS
jgi:DNA-binding transcriptional ArsR family regulator